VTEFSGSQRACVKQLELQRNVRMQKKQGERAAGRASGAGSASAAASAAASTAAAAAAAAAAARSATVSGPSDTERTYSGTARGAVVEQQQRRLLSRRGGQLPSSGSLQEPLYYGARPPAADDTTACAAGAGAAQASTCAVAALVATAAIRAPLVRKPAPAPQQAVNGMFDIWACEEDAPAPPLAADVPPSSFSQSYMDSLLDAPLLDGGDASVLDAQRVADGAFGSAGGADRGSASSSEDLLLQQQQRSFNDAAFDAAFFDAFSLSGSSAGSAGSAAAAVEDALAAAGIFAQNGAAAAPLPLPYRADVVLKLHDVLPDQLPPALAPALLDWWASAPLVMEGHVRPGCTLLTVDVLLRGHDPAAALGRGGGGGGAAQLVEELLRSAAGDFLRSKRWKPGAEWRAQRACAARQCFRRNHALRS
jgi:hypothetical protein